jgi:cytosine/adenosine deaminase-related metal-dependent hydrolase
LINQKLYHADFIIVCDDEFSIIENGAIVFDSNIIDLGSFDKISKKYSNLEANYCGKNSVLMPGLINSHIHLEFSNNKTTLEYGNFIKWLYSVIKNREELTENLNSNILKNVLENILKSGTTTIGAISSYGMDIEACKNSSLRTVLFNEVIGSQANMCDMLFDDFSQRLNQCISLQDERFIPAVAIHSPYSVHPILIRKALQKAKDNNLSVSSHFMESPEEKDWLNSSSGGFKEFFENFLGQSNSLQTPEEFLTLFNGINTSFVHTVQAEQKHFEHIKSYGHSVVTCPVSNRLLTNSKLDISLFEDINLSIGTDGLSSNFSLNLFDELRSALMCQESIEPNILAKQLIKMATLNGAKTLNINSGTLEVGKNADIITLTLPDISSVDNIALMTILHTQKIDNVFVGGKLI